MVKQISKKQVTGIILAGGEGRRMGGKDKGWVLFHSRPLIETAISKLTPQVGHIIISANRSLDRYAALGFPVITDNASGTKTPQTFEGPMAGIISCMEAINTPYAVVVPCDSPYIGVDLVEELVNRVKQTGNPLTLFRVDNYLQPLFGLYHQSLLPSMKQYFASGNRKLIKWCETQGPDVIDYKGDAKDFININSPEEL